MGKTLKIAKNFLGKKVSLIFDRPLGSKHPKYGFIYEVNYGYLPKIIAADNEELDAYYLGVKKPLKKAEGIVTAVIHRENDDDDKLVVIKEGTKITNKEIIKATYFQEQFFKSKIIRK